MYGAHKISPAKRAVMVQNHEIRMQIANLRAQLAEGWRSYWAEVSLIGKRRGAQKLMYLAELAKEIELLEAIHGK
jgi:hypoxanthine-guanine phosphoribosyltransferase